MSQLYGSQSIEIEWVEEDAERLKSVVEKCVNDRLGPAVSGIRQLVSLDGLPSTGKTTLGSALAKYLDARLVSLDDFVEKHQDAYLEAMDLDRLRSVITTGLNLQNPVVVEGCLVEAVFEAASLPSPFRIHLLGTTRMLSGADEEWFDECEVLFGDEETEALITNRDRYMRDMAKFLEEGGISGKPSGMTEFSRELIRYYRKYRPHDRADLLIKVCRFS